MIVSGNRIKAAGENGIEVRNARDINLTDNGIDAEEAGIGVYAYAEESLGRFYSPLNKENAGFSKVVARNNHIFQARQEHQVEEGCQFIILVHEAPLES